MLDLLSQISKWLIKLGKQAKKHGKLENCPLFAFIASGAISDLKRNVNIQTYTRMLDLLSQISK